MAWPYRSGAEVIQCAQPPSVVGSNMLGNLGKRPYHSYPLGASGRDENGADSRIRFSKRLIFSKVFGELAVRRSARLVVEYNLQKWNYELAFRSPHSQRSLTS
jgi:hypothetical protein